MQDAGADRDRGSILGVLSYEVALDLTQGTQWFSSRTEVRFRSREAGASVFADLHAVNVRRATLNGAELDVAGRGVPGREVARREVARREVARREVARRGCDGRLELPGLAEDNVLVVEAEFGYATADAGLHRVAGPDDGSAFVYSRCSAGGAPRIYCCFDEPGLRAPFTVSVNAPAGWSCRANGPVLSRPPEGEPGWWRFAPTPPIPPWLSGLGAGSFSGSTLSWPRTRCDPLDVTIEAFGPAAARLDRVRLAELLQRALRYYERTLGVPYPYGACDLVFGPISPALAYSASGLIIIQDQVLDEDQDALFMPMVIAHELAHAWFGGLVTMPRDQMWLDEALTTYISRTAVAQAIPGATPWATVTSATLPDASYARDAAAIRRLEDVIGTQAVLDGLGTLLRRHAHGDAAKDDLIRYWSQASGQDLRGWADETFLPGEGS